MPTVRYAELSDADAIARVHVTAWQAGYRGQVPDTYLDALDPAVSAERWRPVLEPAGGRSPVEPDGGLAPAAVLVIAAADGDVVGICSLGAPRDPAPVGTGELWMINIAPGSWGQGFGRTLLEAASELLADLGYESAYLWVLDTNERARRLYEHSGWSPDGTEKLDERAGFVLREVRYVRKIATEATGVTTD